MNNTEKQIYTDKYNLSVYILEKEDKRNIYEYDTIEANVLYKEGSEKISIHKREENETEKL
ncbi:Uncharacterised protein [[Clostridium] sordellii]|nr:hypothetical protein [Paeniclostridium sordellii]CEO35426.1 Uncharacterised protein [[Clostridium] sordellii] [Paeniclostridium sordellii]CEP92805.1 Uncharacterised protein [[Clostridium] sordellii] [Paeniclostridium sordellii]